MTWNRRGTEWEGGRFALAGLGLLWLVSREKVRKQSINKHKIPSEVERLLNDIETNVL